MLPYQFLFGLDHTFISPLPLEIVKAVSRRLRERRGREIFGIFGIVIFHKHLIVPRTNVIIATLFKEKQVESHKRIQKACRH
jgi:hypothetical protein